jgi:hypothetical protein
VGPAQPVVILPRAFPDASFVGRVESVGSMAQTRVDRPAWQKYFHVIVGLKQNDDRLRSGMSVLCQVQMLSETNALLAPRAAVRWDAEKPYCLVARHGRRVKQAVALGPADSRRFVVRDGLAEGDRVFVE